MKTIFITGGTGYIGTRLIKKLIGRGHEVIALVRNGSESKVPSGAKVFVGDPFNAASFETAIPNNCVFVQLLGVSHPSPKKKKLFRTIDLASVKASADAAANANVAHLIYVSVSMSPSKIMKNYQQVRREGEAYFLSKNLKCSFVRPWYVLGPGHWWPILLLPFYGLAELVPSWREQARNKGLVTIKQILRTLVNLVESDPPQQSQTVEISAIRQMSLQNI